MIIKKVELINKGNKGIKVAFDGQRKLNDQVSAKRKNLMTETFPLPVNLRLEFHKLKYFFLTMSGIWRDDEWTEYLRDDYTGFIPVDDVLGGKDDPQNAERDRVVSAIMAGDTAFSKTTIDGYEVDGSRIKILGSYEAIEGKKIKISLPFIDENDDYSFHQEATEIMRTISSNIFKYLKEDKLELGDIKTLLAEYLSKDEEIERVKKQTDEENYEELMLRLEQAGAIVIPLEGGKLEKSLNSGSEKVEVVSENTMNANSFEDHESVNEKETEEIKGSEEETIDEMSSDSDDSPVESVKEEKPKSKKGKKSDKEEEEFF